MATLNDRTRKYVALVAAGHNSTAAARAAGYSESFARVAAYRMKQNPTVAKVIEDIRQEGRKQASYSLAEAMREAERALDFAVKHKNPMAMVKATELRAKLSGLLIDRVAVEHVDLAGAMAEAKARAQRAMKVINPSIPVLAVDPFEE